jgi:hypothetical protein
MNVRNFLKAIVGVSILGGALVVTAGVALAASASQSTTLSLTIPSTITLSGLAADYSGTGPAGSATNIDTGPLTVTTNSGNGYHLALQASGPNFVGAGANGYVFAISNDMLSIVSCPAGDACSSAALSDLSAVQLLNRTTSTAGDVFTVRHAISPPANQPPDTYSVSVTYTATTN